MEKQMLDLAEKLKRFYLDSRNRAKFDIFSPDHSFSEMFSYVYNQESSGNISSIKDLTPKKSEEQANVLRNAGNKEYKKQRLDKALLLYNESILMSPHPKPKENCSIYQGSEFDLIKNNYDATEDQFKALALGLANRAAVLLDLGYYKMCILDCDLSLYFGYPKIIACKLFERKAKCCMALGMFEDAVTILAHALDQLMSLDLSNDQVQSHKKNIETLRTLCQNKSKPSNVPKANSNRTYTVKDFPIEYYFRNRSDELPTLPEKNEKVPCLNKAVDVSYSPQYGRYLVANRDIEPGEIILVENTYCKALSFEHMSTHCSSCLTATLHPLPCPSCTKVVFCSESCRSDGLQRFHNVECNLLYSLEKLNLGESLIPLRLLVLTTFPKLKILAPQLNKESEDDTWSGNTEYNEQGIYDTEDYRTFYNLITNKQYKSFRYFIQHALTADYVLNLLLDDKLFFYENHNFVTPSKNDIILLGSLLMRHLIQLHSNSHNISEVTELLSMGIKEVNSIGVGLFTGYSLFSHSCRPSGIRIDCGRVQVFRSTTNIFAGSAVTSCYGHSLSAYLSKEERQHSLLEEYHFECTCEACNKDWPPPSNNTPKVNFSVFLSNVNVKCILCPGIIIGREKSCFLCDTCYAKKVRDKEGEVFNYSSFTKKLHEDTMSIDVLKNSVVSDGSSLQQIKLLENYLKLFVHVQLPNDYYFEAQDLLKHCYKAVYGAHYYEQLFSKFDLLKNNFI